MRIFLTKKFQKNYKKRILPYKNLDLRFEKRRRLFIENPNDPILDDHSLSGKMKGLRAFSIAGDIRVVYYMYEDIAYFVDIGTHNQVY